MQNPKHWLEEELWMTLRMGDEVAGGLLTHESIGLTPLAEGVLLGCLCPGLAKSHGPFIHNAGASCLPGWFWP